MRPLRFTRSRSVERAARSLGEEMARRKEEKPMDDEEAKKEITDALAGRLDGAPIRVGMVALIHALRAIEDRAAMVEAWDDEVGITWAVPKLKAAGSAARRHMKGED